jgi:hypothetical protein
MGEVLTIPGLLCVTSLAHSCRPTAGVRSGPLNASGTTQDKAHSRSPCWQSRESAPDAR